MCLIGYRHNNSELTLQQFINSHDKNSDGLGIMYVENGRVKVEKCMSPKLKHHRKLFETALETQDTFAFHQRMATHGEKNMANCHPYKILDLDEDGMDLYMMHNGVITSIHQEDKTMSDTWHFAEVLKKILKRDPRLIYDDSQFQCFVTGFLGFNNKLLFMNEQNEVLIFNEDRGKYVDGTWFSNAHSIENWKTTNFYNNNNYGSQTTKTTPITRSAEDKSCDISAKPKNEIVALVSKAADRGFNDNALYTEHAYSEEELDAYDTEIKEMITELTETEEYHEDLAVAYKEDKVARIADDYTLELDLYEDFKKHGQSELDKSDILDKLASTVFELEDDEIALLFQTEPNIGVDLFHHLVSRVMDLEGDQKAA